MGHPHALSPPSRRPAGRPAGRSARFGGRPSCRSVGPVRWPTVLPVGRPGSAVDRPAGRSARTGACGDGRPQARAARSAYRLSYGLTPGAAREDGRGCLRSPHPGLTYRAPAGRPDGRASGRAGTGCGRAARPAPAGGPRGALGHRPGAPGRWPGVRVRVGRGRAGPSRGRPRAGAPAFRCGFTYGHRYGRTASGAWARTAPVRPRSGTVPPVPGPQIRIKSSSAPGFWTRSSAERSVVATVPGTCTPRGSVAAERSRCAKACRRPLGATTLTGQVSPQTPGVSAVTHSEGGAS